MSENNLCETVVCLSGAETANYLQFLDYRQGDIYPKIKVQIEVKIEVTIFEIEVTILQIEVTLCNLNKVRKQNL